MYQNAKEQISPETVYQENATSYRYMCDWRNRILARFFLTTGALMGSAAWIWQNLATEFQHLVCVPFFLSFLTSIVFWFADRRNSVLVNACYSVGRALEEKYGLAGGIYTAWEHAPKRYVKARVINSVIYAIVCALTLYGFIATLFMMPTGKS